MGKLIVEAIYEDCDEQWTWKEYHCHLERGASGENMNDSVKMMKATVVSRIEHSTCGNGKKGQSTTNYESWHTSTGYDYN